MVIVGANIFAEILNAVYNFYIEKFSEFPLISAVIQVCFLSVFIILLTLAIWAFYKNLSKKDLIKLDLARYNRYDHPVARKFYGVIFYLIEYMVAIPFFILLWSGALAIAVLLISEGNEPYIVNLTAALIISIRVLAYYKEDLAAELASYFPFVTLTTFLLSPSLFSADLVLAKAQIIPSLLENIIYYFVLIFIVEIFLRFMSTLETLWNDDS